MNIKMTTKFRNMLTSPYAKEMIEAIWQLRDKQDIVIHLSDTEDKYQNAIAEYAKQQWMPKDLLDQYLNVFDGPFLTEMRNAGVINNFEIDDNFENPNSPPDSQMTFMGARIMGLNTDNLKELKIWISQEKYIVSRGNFSLNKITKVAYYKDRFAKFYIKSGEYKIFLKFLSYPYFVSNKENDDLKKTVSNIGRKFDLKTGIFSVFVPHNNEHEDGYLLIDDVI